jgi:superfamily II DNA/RNA helicase
MSIGVFLDTLFYPTLDCPLIDAAAQRELARQTYETLVDMTQVLAKDGYPQINALLCIGGISMAEQSHVFSKGFHMVIATPGRLQDMLEKKKFNLDLCKYVFRVLKAFLFLFD